MKDAQSHLEKQLAQVLKQAEEGQQGIMPPEVKRLLKVFFLSGYKIALDQMEYLSKLSADDQEEYFTQMGVACNDGLSSTLTSQEKKLARKMKKKAANA